MATPCAPWVVSEPAQAALPTPRVRGCLVVRNLFFVEGLMGLGTCGSPRDQTLGPDRGVHCADQPGNDDMADDAATRGPPVGAPSGEPRISGLPAIRPLDLPPPRMEGGLQLMQAIKLRQSTRELFDPIASRADALRPAVGCVRRQSSQRRPHRALLAARHGDGHLYRDGGWRVAVSSRRRMLSCPTWKTTSQQIPVFRISSRLRPSTLSSWPTETA